MSKLLSHAFRLILLCCTFVVAQSGIAWAGEPVKPRLPDLKAEPGRAAQPVPAGITERQQPVQLFGPGAKDPAKTAAKSDTWQIYPYFQEAVRLRNFNFLKEIDDPKLTPDQKRRPPVGSYQEASDKFIAEVRRALKESKGINERMAVIVLVTEIAEKDTENVNEKLGIDAIQGRILRELTNDILELAEPSQPWRLRYVALRALGKITPDPDKAIPAIRTNLVAINKFDGPTYQPEVRRSAAYALVDLAKNAHFLPRSKDGDFPLLQWRTISQVTSTASLGLGSGDELIRAYSLLAVIDAAQSLTNYLSPFNTVDTTGKNARDIEPLPFNKDFPAPKEFLTNKDFIEMFAQFRFVNPDVLNNLRDANPKIQFTALEAFENLFLARSAMVQYLRRKTDNQKDDGRKLLEKAGIPDPLEGLITNRGKAIADLLEKNHDIRERRKAMYLLEAMAEELKLAQEESGPVLNRIVFTLTEKCEDVFVRWSAVNAIRNIIEHEQSPGQKKILVKVLTGMPFAPANVTVDMVLARLLIDPDISTRLDPDISIRVPNTLEALVDLVNSMDEKDQEKAFIDAVKKRLGMELVTMLNAVFWVEPGGGSRFDVETRTAVLKALVAVGGENAAGAINTLLQAMEDPDPRIRRDVAKSFSMFVPLRGKAMPEVPREVRERIAQALTRALRDEDVDVRINATESILNLTKRP